MRILKREAKPPETAHNEVGKPDVTPTSITSSLTPEERELQYQEAKNRIFGDSEIIDEQPFISRAEQDFISIQSDPDYNREIRPAIRIGLLGDCPRPSRSLQNKKNS